MGFIEQAMEPKMLEQIRNWRRTRRYRHTVEALKALSAEELQALGIRPAEIGRLAWAAST